MFHFAFWLILLLPEAIYFNQWVLFLILVFPPLIMWLGIFTTGSPPLTMKHCECAIHKTHMMTPTWQLSANLQSLTSFCCLSHPDFLSRCSLLFAVKHLEKSDILEVNRATAVHHLPPFPSPSPSSSHVFSLCLFLFFLRGLMCNCLKFQLFCPSSPFSSSSVGSASGGQQWWMCLCCCLSVPCEF